MEKYIGVKLVEAEPEIKVINIDESNSISNDGYLVKYEDSYEFWSPKDVFEKAYRKIKDGIPLDKGNWLPYQERVVQEAKELRENSDKLFIFINSNDKYKLLDKGEQNRLTQQLMTMQHYLTILIERIENF
jgi:hypothetical protein